MVVYRPRADAKNDTNLLVALSYGDPTQHFGLTFGKAKLLQKFGPKLFSNIPQDQSIHRVFPLYDTLTTLLKPESCGIL